MEDKMMQMNESNEMNRPLFSDSTNYGSWKHRAILPPPENDPQILLLWKRGEMTTRRYRVVPVLLLLAFLALFFKLDITIEPRKTSLLELQLQSKLKLLNKPAVKTIKSEDGDIIDCIDIYKQPAFDHPALKNHTIQRIPDFLLESQKSSTEANGSSSSQKVFQTWQKSGSCPKGTVPIRRIQKNDLLRSASSLDRFGQKPPGILFMNKNINNTKNLDSTDHALITAPNISDAYLLAYAFNFIGSQADINIWNPNVELPEDFTTAQMWLKAASNDEDMESVEAGWVVNPKLYGDHRTRIFAYWTIDSYKTTGCFDATCPGFVQVSSQVALGSALEAISSIYGPQYDFNVGIFWDESGNWWLRMNNDVTMGYWPAEILGALRHSARIVEWGGQVHSNQVGTAPHTGTAMGSGESADGRYGIACYIKNVRIKDYSLSLKYPKYVTTNSREPYCYNAINDVKPGFYPVFYFGGPGRHPPYCP